MGGDIVFYYVDTVVVVVHSAAEAVAPAIALCTTSVDMVTWMTALLTILRHDEASRDHTLQDILPPDVLQEVTRPQISVTDPQMYESEIVPPATPVTLLYDKYGLAWFVGQYEGTSHRQYMADLWQALLESNTYLEISLIDLDISLYEISPSI